MEHAQTGLVDPLDQVGSVAEGKRDRRGPRLQGRREGGLVEQRNNMVDDEGTLRKLSHPADVARQLVRGAKDRAQTADCAGVRYRRHELWAGARDNGRLDDGNADVKEPA
jgi:hypothetical protein